MNHKTVAGTLDDANAGPSWFRDSVRVSALIEERDRLRNDMRNAEGVISILRDELSSSGKIVFSLRKESQDNETIFGMARMIGKVVCESHAAMDEACVPFDGLVDRVKWLAADRDYLAVKSEVLEKEAKEIRKIIDSIAIDDVRTMPTILADVVQQYGDMASVIADGLDNHKEFTDAISSATAELPQHLRNESLRDAIRQLVAEYTDAAKQRDNYATAYYGLLTVSRN